MQKFSLSPQKDDGGIRATEPLMGRLPADDDGVKRLSDIGVCVPKVKGKRALDASSTESRAGDGILRLGSGADWLV